MLNIAYEDDLDYCHHCGFNPCLCVEEEEDIDIGICMTCGSYGETGKTCGRTAYCRELGSEYL